MSKDLSRREAVKTIAIVVGGVVTLIELPSRWTRPVVESIVDCDHDHDHHHDSGTDDDNDDHHNNNHDNDDHDKPSYLAIELRGLVINENPD